MRKFRNSKENVVKSGRTFLSSKTETFFSPCLDGIGWSSGLKGVRVDHGNVKWPPENLTNQKS